MAKLKTIALASLDKPIQTFRSSARVAIYIARIGILAQKTGPERIYDLAIAALREFDSRQFKKQEELGPDSEEHEALLLTELHRLFAESQDRHFLLDDAVFFRRMEPGDIASFIDAFSAKD